MRLPNQTVGSLRQRPIRYMPHSVLLVTRRSRCHPYSRCSVSVAFIPKAEAVKLALWWAGGQKRARPSGSCFLIALVTCAVQNVQARALIAQGSLPSASRGWGASGVGWELASQATWAKGHGKLYKPSLSIFQHDSWPQWDHQPHSSLWSGPESILKNT